MINIPNDAPVLLVRPEDIPVAITEEFPTSEGNIELTLEFHYNQENDFYSCNIFDTDNNLLGCVKVVYGVDLFNSISSRLGLQCKLFPVDINREATVLKSETVQVTKSNFGRSVFLVIV